MTAPTARRRLWATTAAALLALLAAGPALALPPDGPGPETPGTSSRVWPTELRAGETLNFEVSGFPPNETVYIKIDDGTMCTDTSHGACVYHTQRLDANGYASGSLVLPADLAPGDHWLRMLGTGDVFDERTGEKIGYTGYTRRGGNDFRIVAAGTTGDAGGGSAAAAGDEGAVAVDLGELVEETAGETPAAEAPVTGSAEAGPGEETVPDVAPAGSGEADAQAAPVAAPVAEPTGTVPVVGIAALAGAVVLGGGMLTWAALRRRRLAAATRG